MPTHRSRFHLTRRQMLGGACAAAGVGVLGQGLRTGWQAAAQEATPGAPIAATPHDAAQHAAAATPAATPASVAISPAVPGVPYAEPPALRSENGRLEVAFEAQLAPTMIGGREVISFAYNGQVPGPTLRLKPGETLALTLSNNLDQATNFHTHGLHISPSGNSDNVFVHIEPGEQFQFEFQLPEDGISGLSIPGFFWYHPHVHGHTGIQVTGGMFGALIVEGGLEDLPELRDIPDHIMMLQVAQYASDGTMIEFPDFDIADVYLNGQYQPEMTIAPGETQRWRVLNASSSTFMNLELEGHTLHQIAADGNALNAPWARETLLLSPGERADILVQGGAPGRYAFRSSPWGTGFQEQPELAIATLISAGEAVAPMPLPAKLIPFDDLRDAEVDRVRELVFSENADPFAVFIDGQTFDADRVDQTVQLGSTEEWRISNTSEDWHPFHIHVNDFQVISVNGEPIEPRSWEDTVGVPGYGEIVIRSRFLDFPGKFVYHCHILDHEDAGMMGVVEVVDGAVAGATPEAGG